MSDIILIRTDNDTASFYLFSYCDEVIDKARKRGHKVITIDSENVKEGEVITRIKKIKPNFVFLNGHGSNSCFYGQKGEKVITREDAFVFKNKLVFARACNCLNGLGKEAVKQGCKCFIGYNSPFWIARIHEMETR